ncbi:hypothetical protein MtrunA17_Chr2g0279541 [Medicago truncatula]|uniref:Leguminosin group485 secreted peptide n=1 Tax=Medicago truncatula TaxID=3880 RepID=G7IPN4_MEDTR|nr:proline-rich receptor-like protein kinase PERK2 [Medicago truncatula]AES63507.1 leguminosin group485 secreted peptide [Medicago truncatula]RHN71688.1 hypothetical protein MtrunA17_Chr2g0279541 [Medicago truncatula]
MASYNSFILAIFIAISFSNMDITLAARNLLQTTNPTTPTLPKPTLLPPLPTIPAALPKPTQPSIPQFTLPPLPNTLPTIFPFFSPPPSKTNP